VKRSKRKAFEKCFENAKSMLKVLVVLQDTIWSQPFEKGLREVLGVLQTTSPDLSGGH
jgi:hypothetical protein